MNSCPNSLEFLDFENMCAYQHIAHISLKTLEGDICCAHELSLVIFKYKLYECILAPSRKEVAPCSNQFILWA
jgi:hypothetical protein